MTLSYSTICERLRAHAKYTPEADFGEGHLEYPPASELSVQVCEAKLGFKLPPMLREIYKTVANGGNFWPGYDFATTDDLIEQHNSFLRYYVSSRNQSRLFDDATVEALRTHPGAYACPEYLPDGFLRLVHTGCNVWANLEGSTGRLYLNDEVPEDTTGYSFCAGSLEEWLERKMSVPSSRSNEGRYQPHYPLTAELANANGESETQAEKQETDDGMTKQYHHRYRDGMADFRNQLLTGLEKARMEITQQIYRVDAMQRSITESDWPTSSKYDWLFDLGLTMRELAETEAQLDHSIAAPWLFRS